ncbi:MAG: DUF1223 domain-containing protein [Acidobacteriota bacterium]|nr:DUF1223 domain-containing protein [Acidobacteriota bacterium]
MKALFATSILALSIGCAAQALDHSGPKSSNDDEPAVFRTQVLVELFTSEGCSSCPPAEELLAKFDREQPVENVELITLAFHVDYWDELGWKDKYASPLFTQRQRIYDRKFRTGQIYTPQMVVDGEIGFVGSREKDAKKAIEKSVKAPKAAFDLSIDGNQLRISISEIPNTEQSTVFVAFAEDGLGSDVKSGENAGKMLKHVSVVRELRAIGRLSGTDQDFKAVVPLLTDQSWQIDNMRIIIFIQENASRRIHGVSRISLSNWANN